jgi:hypothetical protein
MFIVFIKQYILPEYSKLWNDFTDIKYDSNLTLNVSADKLLPEIESRMCMERSKFMTNRHDLFQAFTTRTFIKQSVICVDIFDLYPRILFGETSVVLFPSYVWEVCLNNNKVLLCKALFTALEQSVWDIYISTLAIESVYLFKSPSFAATDNSNNIDSQEEIQSVNVLMQNILYYICGSSFHAMLCILHSEYFGAAVDMSMLEAKLREHLTVANYSTVIALNLPASKIMEKEKIHGRLICVNRQIFDIILDIETNIFSNVLNDMRLLAVFGSNLLSYVKAEIYNHGYASKLEDLFSPVVFISSQNDTLFDHIKIVKQLSAKFIDFYCNVMARDYVTNIMSKMELGSNPLRSVSFRLGVLTNTLDVKIES